MEEEGEGENTSYNNYQQMATVVNAKFPNHSVSKFPGNETKMSVVNCDCLLQLKPHFIEPYCSFVFNLKEKFIEKKINLSTKVTKPS